MPWLEFDGGWAAGQSFVLKPADRVRFAYDQAARLALEADPPCSALQHPARTIAKSLIQGSYEFQGVEGIGAEIIGSGSKRLFGFLGR